MAYLVGLLGLVGIIGGVLSYEASGALPGDALYMYKVVVNEQAEEWLAQGDVAKAQWNLTELQERLREAQTLANQNRLNVATQTQITDNITTHVQDLTAILDRLQAEGKQQDAATIAAQLYATLQSEAGHIADISAQGSTTMQIALAPVLVRVRTTLATIALISTGIQAKAGVVPTNVPTLTER